MNNFNIFCIFNKSELKWKIWAVKGRKGKREVWGWFRVHVSSVVYKYCRCGFFVFLFGIVLVLYVRIFEGELELFGLGIICYHFCCAACCFFELWNWLLSCKCYCCVFLFECPFLQCYGKNNLNMNARISSAVSVLLETPNWSDSYRIWMYCWKKKEIFDIAKNAIIINLLEAIIVVFAKSI